MFTSGEDEMGSSRTMHGKKKNAYRILVGKPEGKRPLGRARHRWEDNIEMDYGDMGWYGLD
jgi:hypothetical protein